MAYTTTHLPQAEAGQGIVARFFGGLVDSLVRMAEADPRFRKLNALAAMSDEELARRGLRRDQIAREVLGGTYYI